MMVVKEERGRRRYVAFSVDPGLDKPGLIALLRRQGDAPYVVQCGSGLAVVRCAPSETAALAETMRRAVPGSASLMTSGTLKALRTKVPGLGRPAKVKGKD